MSSTIASEVLSASIGGAISAGILYPLEVLKTKMQAVDSSSSASSSDDKEKEGEASSITPQGMVPFAKHLYQTQGLSVFFHGLETSSFQSALEKALYFFSYTALKQIHKLVSKGAELGTVSNLVLGYAAEWAHLPISLPVDAWTTEIQTSKQNRAPLQILLAMLSDKNRNFYKGISAYVLLALKPALQYTVYEQVKTAFLKSKTRKTLSATEAFLLGMLARTVATVLVFPFLRAKVLMQTQKQLQGVKPEQQQGGTASPPPPSTTTLNVLWNQWQTQGMPGLFQGLGPELTRGVLSAALMLMIKERVAGTVHLLLERKSRSR